jgi:hypothetical protein
MTTIIYLDRMVACRLRRIKNMRWPQFENPNAHLLLPLPGSLPKRARFERFDGRRRPVGGATTSSWDRSPVDDAHPRVSVPSSSHRVAGP